MSGTEPVKGGEESSVALKILYTLHGTDSQRYIVKPSRPVEARLFRDLELGTVAIKTCLDAIREVSPDFSSICDTHGDEYAVYSTDYAEDELPLQSHGKVSQSGNQANEATGKLGLSKLMREQLELLIHFLPVRRPDDMIADFHQKTKTDAIYDQNGNEMNPQVRRKLMSFPLPPSFINPSILPPLPPQVQIPSSLASGSVSGAGSGSGSSMKSDTVLPSSPPIRAKPTKASSSSSSMMVPSSHPLSSAQLSSTLTTAYPDLNINTAGMSNGNLMGEMSTASPTGSHAGAKRAASEQSISKKRKASSPKSDNEAQCGNCGVVTASTWRRARCPDGKGELLCNACGLYYRAKKVMRPRFLWDKMRSRSDQENMSGNNVDLSATNASTAQQPSDIASSAAYSSSSSSSSAQAVNTRIENAPTPQDAGQPLWSREQATAYITSDPIDLSDRLVDNPASSSNIIPKQTVEKPKSQHQQPDLQDSHSQGTETNNLENEHNGTKIDRPSTPERRTIIPIEPDSMQKWLGLTTPDQRLGFMIPGSGSARKWLDKAMNPTHFDEIWNSPTPRKNKLNIPDLAIFTSSPPTSSSNMLSEVAEWNLVNPSPGTPQALKFFKGTETELLEPQKDTTQNDVCDSPKPKKRTGRQSAHSKSLKKAS